MQPPMFALLEHDTTARSRVPADPPESPPLESESSDEHAAVNASRLTHAAAL